MKIVSLQDACERVDYGLTTSAVLDGDGPRFLRITDIDRTFVQWSSVPRCEASPEEASKYALKTGDIVVARTGASTGRSQWVEVTEPSVFASYLVRFRASSEYDSRFLGYVLSSQPWQDHVASVAHGKSAQPNMSASEMARFSFSCPELPEQRAIAEVLGALDDKIAANTKLIESITEYVSTRFDSAVYAESTQINLADVCEFQNRKRVPLSAREREDREGSIPYYGASGIFGYVDEPIFNETLVLVGEDGSVIRDDGTPVTQYIWGPAWVNNHAHVLRGTSIPTDLLYFAIRRQQVASLVTGAVQPKISMGNLKRLTLELPSATALEQLSGLAAVSMASYRCLSEENRTLAATRDTLLPQLMSGKLRVRDIENTMGEMV